MTQTAKQAEGSGGGRRWKNPQARWLLAGAGVAVAMALLVVLTQALAGPKTTGGERGVSSSDFPDFSIIVYQGDGHLGGSKPHFASLLGNRPIVMNYWASNCPPCTAEMPELEKVWQQYGDRVLFVGLDVGRFFPGFGDQARSKLELRRLGVTYPAGTPPSVDVVQQLGVPGLPATQFITPDGKLHRQWVGILNEAKLTELVEELLVASSGKR